MEKENKTGIFLCECGGKISNRIDLAKVSDLLQYEPWAHLGVYPYPCLAPGLEAMRREIQSKGLNRILVGGCSSRVMKKRFTKALEPVGIEKHQVEMINLKDHVAAVHEANPQELARKAAALLAGGLASLRLLEAYEPVSLTFEGPALILGGGVSGFVAARELARQGMGSVLFSKVQTPERVLDELHWTFPGCRIFCGELGELLREVFTSPLVRVMPDQPIEYIIGGVGDYRVGLKQPDGSVTEVAGAAIITALDREFGPGNIDYIGGGGRVCDLLDFEEKLGAGDISRGKVVFWVNSPQHGQAAQELATVAAWRDSLLLAREHPQASPTVLYPANVTLPLTGSDMMEARAHGIGLVSYAPEVHPVIQSGFLSFVSPSDNLESEVEWDTLVVPGAPAEPAAKAQELMRWLPIYSENGGTLQKSNIKFWPDQIPDESLFFTGSAGGICDLNEVLQQGKKAARGVLSLREKALQGRLVSPVVVHVDKDLCEGCGLCTEICPCGGIEHVKPGSGPVARETDNHLCSGGGTCAATCPHEAIKVVNNTTQQLEARVKAILDRMEENEILSFICGWGGSASAEQAAVKGLTYPSGIYLVPVNCLGSLDPAMLSMALLNGVKGIMLAGCTPKHSCHYHYGVDHCWYRVNAMKKLLSLAGLERRRISIGYVEVNEPEAFVRMVESQMETLGKLPPLPKDEQTKAKLWAIHATMHRPRVRWVLGTSLRRPAEKEFPGSQFNAVEADETMLDVLKEEFTVSRIFKALHDQPLNPPDLARAMGEPVKTITPILTDMSKDGRITIKGWNKGYPIYAMGKA
ncbi:MAG: hydrogenase iron-sulfur subunit [Syntrophobacterales bacterium]|jgi:coenzyme F420-reducing hydrogenase delta subunit/Pyruvate/2-oxoacid:ferredoxin oxidoreductase delta subunit|nr:hydrogenase iron-sulfur subunit [Syntrophobacterales bacterium]